ncbi:serine/threonine-protein kinase Nek3 [Lepisosteus oculatus]|uniref:serine/threonine-protein kinase Nek3 n=1 Tax=Lepisosteus oculatus TaxID=7918 RepID=UPI00372251E9
METYVILKIVGEGSFGQALLVKPKNQCEQYVLKQVRLPRTESGKGHSRKEATLLAKMKHPNIVAFRESFEADGYLHIVMEFCAGGDLLQRIKQQRGKLFSEDVIIRWFVQMCLGTKHIHDKRVLHRDLKSKNIFLTDKGVIKLGDFGSACILNNSKAYAYTYVGTPYYVSPEIWDSKPYNNKSDVWSLGCVLYELCTLQHPFQARSWKSLILKVCRGSYPPLPSALSYDLHYLIKHMFKTDPRDRPSLNTILTRHRVSRLLRKHMPPQVQLEEQTGKWKKEEGELVAKFLGEKSLEGATSTVGETTAGPDVSAPGSSAEPSRKKWDEGPCNTLLEVLGNADLVTSSTMEPTDMLTTNTGGLEYPRSRPRMQWVKKPPERLLSLLEKAHLSEAFKTYTVCRPAKFNPLVGPLTRGGCDDTDGDIEDSVDSYRLEPRSDDEDTDFEEETFSDWVTELEKISK